MTLTTTFYDVSVLCYRFPKALKYQIWFSGNAGVKALKTSDPILRPNERNSTLEELDDSPIYFVDLPPETLKCKLCEAVFRNPVGKRVVNYENERFDSSGI